MDKPAVSFDLKAAEKVCVSVGKGGSDGIEIHSFLSYIRAAGQVRAGPASRPPRGT